MRKVAGASNRGLLHSDLQTTNELSVQDQLPRIGIPHETVFSLAQNLTVAYSLISDKFGSTSANPWRSDTLL